MTANSEANHFQFVASTANIISIYQLINAISLFGDNCFLNITNDGLSFSIVANNICKVLLTLDKRLFSDYEFDPIGEVADLGEEEGEEDQTTESITINLDLRSFLETINIHIPNDRETLDMRTKCTLSYQTEGSPFILTFEDDYIIERCELLTYFVDPEARQNVRVATGRHKSKDTAVEGDEIDNYQQMVVDNTIFQLDSSKIIFDIVLKSSILYDALKDMNDLNTDEFILYCSKRSENSKINKKRLIFISRSEDSSIGYSKLIIPEKKPFLKQIEVFKPVRRISEEDGIDEMIMASCSASVSSFYRFQYFAKIIKAIKLSKLIKVRKDMNGLTSFLILIGSETSRRDNMAKNGDSSSVNASNTHLFYGTSIEFITLESIPLEERILSGESLTNVDRNAIALKFGYNNKAIERLIQDEENIKVIRVTGDGQLTTLDDYFHTSSMNDTEAETDRGFDVIMPPPSSTNLKHRAPSTSSFTTVPLQITEELARSVLGLGMNATEAARSARAAASASTIDVDRTVSEEEDSNDDNQSKGGKRVKNANLTRTRKRSKRKENGKGNGIETVGGAIEIPLFI
ncbi:hypothetical protein FOA43_004379 [Brettanomyces nanus]|uniref:Uncharacterized protein n=1 Tax=Eeniella nana TaxID=13502 RepID=A0A875SA66_EENNA|nr:uncharacterized protein FOA43_004379 [Brettanomyces nanus]QPG76985.1 hypothetical protein FOA43_004379 [Brettanomyces nanus]